MNICIVRMCCAINCFFSASPVSYTHLDVYTRQAYYLANKPADSDWVVLPVANFDAYFGTTSFWRKYLKQIPKTLLERSETGFGLCRYRLGEGVVIE